MKLQYSISLGIGIDIQENIKKNVLKVPGSKTYINELREPELGLPNESLTNAFALHQTSQPSPLAESTS
jgi:hypothetical protein